MVVVLRMGIGPQNDPGTHGERLGGGVSTDQMLKLFGFFSGQFNGISGFGTSHMVSPFIPVYPLTFTVSNTESTCDSLYLVHLNHYTKNCSTLTGKSGTTREGS